MITKKPPYHKRIHNRRNLSEDSASSEPKEKGKKLNSWVALGISIVALLLSVASFLLDNILAGQLVIYPPTGFCVVRGYKDIGFPSDHLVLPLTMENTGKGVKTIQSPVLTIREKNSGLEYTYQMAGMISDLYRETADQSYQVGFSAFVPEHSVREYYLVFHIQDWWDVSKPEFQDFHFRAGQEWQVSISYLMNGKKVIWHKGSNQNFFTMPMYGTIDNLKFDSSYNSDCFAVR